MDQDKPSRLPRALDALLLYKILPAAEWSASEQRGEFAGCGIDHSDGFIHLSSAAQVPGTLEAHFAGQTDLVCLEVDPAELGSTLRWEKSRGGDLFPHVYGTIPLAAIRGVLILS